MIGFKAVLGGSLGVAGLLARKPLQRLFTVDLPNQVGPRLEDTSATPIGYGQSINYVKGLRRVTATVIHQFPLVETVNEEKVESGGKGGSTSYNSTTYTYSATFAVMICAQRIQGVRRIWLNSKLFYENRPFMSGDIAQARDAAQAKFNIYNGTTTQAPDPILQARLGNRTPAYRGRAYIVFDDLQLEEFGNRVPVVDVEVVEMGVGSTANTPIPFPLYLRDIVADLCLRAGLPESRFDVTQLDNKVDGYSITDGSSALDQLRTLADLYHFFPQEQGDKLVFVKNPVPVSRIEHQTNCLINEDGLIVNAYHTVEGRQGYFPPQAGTSEGQFLMIRAACLAYQQTNDATWLQIINILRKPIDGLYLKAPPADPNELYIPHWLFVVKAPVTAQSEKLNVRVTMVRDTPAGVYRGTVPTGAPNYGDRVRTVTRLYADDGSFLDWENPFAGVIGTDYGAPTRVDVTANGTIVEIPIANVPNTPSVVTANAICVYEFGSTLDVSQNMEAWPYWRPMEAQEISCAVDSIPWAMEAFELLHQVTGEQQYADARDASAQNAYTTFDVDDGRAWFRPIDGDALTLSGSYVSSSRAGFNEEAITRNRDLTLTIAVPEGDGEAQFGRGLKDEIRASDTAITIDLAIANDIVGTVSFFVQSGTDVTTATRWYYDLVVTPNSIDAALTIALNLWEPRKLFQSGWSPIVGSPLVAGTKIDVVGIIVTTPSAMAITLRRLRPIPEIQLPYTPHVAPYTANAVNGALIDWRGSPGVGYQDPVLWATLQNTAGLSGMLDFIEDSQAEYATRYTETGPFMPSYVWDRFDRQGVTDQQPNTWTFDWVDPNSEWVGYTARVVAMTAQAGDIAAANGDTTNAARCFAVASSFITYLNSVWTDPNRFIPTNFPETIPQIQRNTAVATNSVGTIFNGYIYRADVGGTTAASAPSFPTTLGATVQDGSVTWRNAGYTYGTSPVYGEYDEPHAASLFMRAAAYLHKNNVNTTASLAIVQRCWTYLERLWAAAQPYPEVAGTWSHNPQNGEWFGFWSGEIVTTLSKLQNVLSSVRIAAGISSATINERLTVHGRWILSKSRVIDVKPIENYLLETDYTQTRAKESDLPKRVELKYASTTRNNAEDMRAALKRSARSEKIDTVTAPVSLSGDDALTLVARMLNRVWTQRTSWTFEATDLTWQAGDVREFLVSDTIRRMQLIECNYNPDGYQEITAVSYDGTVFTGAQAGSGDPRSTSGVQGIARTDAVLLDIPLHRDDFDGIGFTTHAIVGGGQWRGGRLIASPDDSIYVQQADFITQPTYGNVVNAIPSKLTTLADNTTVINVALTNGQLVSVTEAEWRRGFNVALCGDEIIYFRSASLQGDGTYNLTGLLRGMRGSQDAVGAHSAGERFLLLSGQGLVNVPMSQQDLGVNRFYKAVTSGQVEADVTPFQASINAIRQRPLKPVHLRCRRFTDSAVIDWKRQTRLSAPWVDGIDSPLDAQAEQYVIQLRQSIGGAVLATYSTTAPALTLTSAQINSTYGSPTATLFIAVAQQNQTFGVGPFTELQA